MDKQLFIVFEQLLLGEHDCIRSIVINETADGCILSMRAGILYVFLWLQKRPHGRPRYGASRHMHMHSSPTIAITAARQR